MSILDELDCIVSCYLCREPVHVPCADTDKRALCAYCGSGPYIPRDVS